MQNHAQYTRGNRQDQVAWKHLPGIVPVLAHLSMAASVIPFPKSKYATYFCRSLELESPVFSAVLRVCA